jgi:hypothetical protein
VRRDVAGRLPGTCNSPQFSSRPTADDLRRIKVNVTAIKETFPGYFMSAEEVVTVTNERLPHEYTVIKLFLYFLVSLRWTAYVWFLKS